MKDIFDPGFFSEEEIELARSALEGSLERREFIKKAGRWAGGLLLAGSLGALAGCGKKAEPVVRSTVPSSAPATQPAATSAADLAVAMGPSPAEITRKAIDAIGGMGRFVKPGYTVVVKPNASFMDGPQAGTSTHPEVAAQVVALCREAGATRVIVMDHTLRGAAQTCLASNGIGAAVKQAGGEILAFGAGDSGHGVDAAVPKGIALRQTNIYPEVLKANLVVTVPKAKHHGSAGLSLGMKNFIGVVTDMSNIHNVGLHQGIADLNTLVRPGLSVVDATTILLDNGPGGPGPTRAANTVIASRDVVAADAYACTLFGVSPSAIGYIKYANRAGLREIDYNRLRIARV